MASDSQANARRKRLATKKLQERAARKNDQENTPRRDEKLDQPVAYGQRGDLGSGSEIGSAKDAVSQENKEG